MDLLRVWGSTFFLINTLVRNGAIFYSKNNIITDFKACLSCEMPHVCLFICLPEIYYLTQEELDRHCIASLTGSPRFLCRSTAPANRTKSRRTAEESRDY